MLGRIVSDMRVALSALPSSQRRRRRKQQQTTTCHCESSCLPRLCESCTAPHQDDNSSSVLSPATRVLCQQIQKQRSCLSWGCEPKDAVVWNRRQVKAVCSSLLLSSTSSNSSSSSSSNVHTVKLGRYLTLGNPQLRYQLVEAIMRLPNLRSVTLTLPINAVPESAFKAICGSCPTLDTLELIGIKSLIATATTTQTLSFTTRKARATPTSSPKKHRQYRQPRSVISSSSSTYHSEDDDDDDHDDDEDKDHYDDWAYARAASSHTYYSRNPQHTNVAASLIKYLAHGHTMGQSNVHTIKFESCRLNDDDITTIHQQIQDYHPLCKLAIVNNKTTVTKTKTWAQLLSTNGIEHLVLSNCDVIVAGSNQDDACASWRALSDALLSNPTLKSLHLSQNILQVPTTCNSITNNTNTTTGQLPVPVQDISSLLSNTDRVFLEFFTGATQQLESLDLSRAFPFHEAVLVAMFQTLQSSDSSLKSLVLNDCDEVVPIQSISEMIASNTTLESLVIDCRRRQQPRSGRSNLKDASRLANAMKTNYSMKQIDLTQYVKTNNVTELSAAPWKQIQLYLRLNQCDRRSLVLPAAITTAASQGDTTAHSDTSQNDWAAVIAQAGAIPQVANTSVTPATVAMDLSALYWMLRYYDGPHKAIFAS